MNFFECVTTSKAPAEESERSVRSIAQVAKTKGRVLGIRLS
jgi:hypothetical protein